MKGAQFTVDYYSSDTASGTPSKTWVFETDEYGIARLSDAYKVSGPELYKVRGSVQMPLGTITIRETKAPEGYFISDETYTVLFKEGPDKKAHAYRPDGSLCEIVTDSNRADLQVSVREKRIRGGVSFKKADENLGAASGDGSLSGAVITIYAAETIADGSRTYTKDQAVLTVTTDEKGEAATGERALASGAYYAKETAASRGYAVNTAWKPEFVIGSAESDDGKRISVEEVLKETPLKGGVKAAKIDRESNGAAQGWASFEGAVIEIVNDSVHDVFVNGTKYAKGETVLTLTTDENGEAGTGADVLPYGTYSATEKAESRGYLLNSDWKVTFRIREDKVVVDTASDAGKIASTANDRSGWYLVSDAKDGSAAKLPEQIKRADVCFTKTDIDGSRLSLIPFLISRLDEEGNVVESHVVATDENGMLNTKDRPKTGEKVNSLDAYVTDGVFTDESKLSGDTGIWFGEGDEESQEAKKGSLIYADYVIEEIRCEANKGQEMLKVTLFAEDLTSEGLREKFVDGETYTLENIFIDLIIHPESDLVDDASGTKIASLGPSVTYTDTIRYDHLKTGSTYKIKTDICFVPDDGSKERIVGTNTVTFSPPKSDVTGTANGTVKNTVTVNSEGLAEGYIAAVDTFFVTDDGGNDTLLVVHNEDLTDVRQMLFIPSIRTTAVDADTGEHIGAASKEARITDTVEYKGLADGGIYLLEGTLRYADTGEAVTGRNGEICRVFKELRIDYDADAVTAKSYGFLGPKDGSALMPAFEFDASALGERALVVTEVLYDYRLYDAGADDNSAAVVAAHYDLTDEKQTVRYAKIETTVAADDTNDHVSKARETMTVTDTVRYFNLTPGRTYIFSGVLVDKSTGEPILSNGKKVETQREYTPAGSKGEVELSFTFDGSALAGTAVVAFERVTCEGKEIAVHADLSDEAQTIYIPGILTEALADDTLSHETVAKEKVSITDVITMNGLMPDTTYTVKGELMLKETDESLGVTKSVTFTTDPAGEETAGSFVIHMPFEFDASGLSGQTVVVFETLYLGEYEVAVHRDIESDKQSVRLEEQPAPVKEPEPRKDSPPKREDMPKIRSVNTGDAHDMSGMLVLLIPAVSGFAAILIKKRKDAVNKG